MSRPRGFQRGSGSLAIKILNGEVLHGAHVRIGVDRKSNQLRSETMSREAMA
ncbi:MAG: hypothetical protein ABR924_05420 [Terracidiphilus sp.]